MLVVKKKKKSVYNVLSTLESTQVHDPEHKQNGEIAF